MIQSIFAMLAALSTKGREREIFANLSKREKYLYARARFAKSRIRTDVLKPQGLEAKRRRKQRLARRARRIGRAA